MEKILIDMDEIIQLILELINMNSTVGEEEEKDAEGGHGHVED